VTQKRGGGTKIGEVITKGKNAGGGGKKKRINTEEESPERKRRESGGTTRVWTFAGSEQERKRGLGVDEEVSVKKKKGQKTNCSSNELAIRRRARRKKGWGGPCYMSC